MSESVTPMQNLRRRMYVMRNGVLADSLRASGCPYRLIWGLNLPQLTDIARETEPSRELAVALWHDTELREARLMAPMLYPAAELTYDEALAMARDVRWAEDADILCFKLMRHTPYAARLAARLAADDAPLMRYTGLRLYFRLVAEHAAEALAAAEAELRRPDALTALASMLAEEARFVAGE